MKNSSGICPTGHHILVKPDVVEEKTAGGIYLAPTGRDQEQRSCTKGVVIEIGHSAWADLADGEPWAKVSEYVTYAMYSGFEMTGSDGEKYTLLNDQDVLAVLKK